MQRWLCGESIKFFVKNKLYRYVLLLFESVSTDG